jgi:DNA-binding YbaB/EbfC family protein
MFKELKQIASLMGQTGRIKEEMERMQQRVAQLTVEGDAGGGMVKVRANGKMEVLACTISEEALKLNDRELLEDMIKGAVNQAIDKARKAAAEETLKMATDLGLPAGMNLPGMGG